MRTLFDILESAKDGEMPTHEECYWAMLALDALSSFDFRALRRLASEPENLFNNPRTQYEETFKRTKRALNVDPQTWMGTSNDPSNPERQKERALFKRLADKVCGGS